MSRIFEALKEARRQRDSGVADDPVWQAVRVPDAQASAPTPALPRNADIAVPAMEKAAPEANTQKVAIATDAQARLDQGARLLPHAVSPTVIEHYRRLRTKILQQQEVKPFRSLVVTSASPQEGKTVTVLNLALSFSALPGFRVLVIDGDLRRGTLGDWLGADDHQAGLSNVLQGSAALEDVVLRSDHIPMHFIVRGNAELHDLHSSHFAGHFQRLGELYDLVLIDSPPANLLADVQLLADNSDAVLLVARAFATTRKSLEKAAQELAPFRIIGAVLNAGVAQRPGRYSGYYY